MFTNSKSHIFFNEAKIASKSGAVVFYKSAQKEDNFHAKKFLAGIFMAFSLLMLSLQAGWVYKANAQDNPITSPITSAEASPSPVVCPSGYAQKLVNSIIVCISQSNTQSQTNTNQTNNNTTNNTEATNTQNTPITSPEISPSPSPSGAPITSPEVSPSPASKEASPSPSNNNGGNSAGSSLSSGNGSVSAPSCGEEAPKSAPKIISALTTGKNEITLTWEKAEGPVTYYLVAYGFEKNKPIYGNPDVGNTTSYTIKGLSGGFTYYFRVRAGNGCKPGGFSEEILVKVGGKFINSPAKGFKSGVLGSFKAKYQNKLALAKPVVFPLSYGNKPGSIGLVGKVFNFFKGLFN